MIQIHFNPMADQEIRWQHEELIKRTALERLAKESTASQLSKYGRTSRVLAKIGKGLINLGSSLEERYGSEACQE